MLPLLTDKCKNVIGFKAESELSRPELIAKAKSRMDQYGLTAIVANDIDVAGRSATSVILINKDGETDISGTKSKVSDALMDYCASIL